MKKLLMICLLLTGCGYHSRDNEMMGQVKKVNHNTPLICSDYNDADISLGVMRNGVGSMSHEDVWVYVDGKEMYDVFKKAAESGAVVKVTYDVKRFSWCVPHHRATKIEIAQ